jgi:hypothetical protein
MPSALATPQRSIPAIRRGGSGHRGLHNGATSMVRDVGIVGTDAMPGVTVDGSTGNRPGAV